MLIANGVDVNDTDYDLRTALHLAASNGQSAVCKYLCSNTKTDINPVDRLGIQHSAHSVLAHN